MWRKLACKKSDIQLIFSLCGGQCFRWKKTGEQEWTGVFGHCVWTLQQTDDCILYKVTGASIKTVADQEQSVINTKHKRSKKAPCKITIQKSDTDYNALLQNYLRLDVNLEEHYDSWSRSDPHFMDAAVKFYGVRILSQDPTENLFAFICSSNNNIARISSMVEKLCVLYGHPIADIDGVTYYDFPTVSALAAPSVEQALRNAGFGYRAKFIQQSAHKITELGGSEWLESLKRLSYAESKVELMKLPGIGAKVADCICLMSLGHLEAIPVDTHIFQVAVARYLPHLKSAKSVTDRVYNEIGNHFRELYGPYAGWAHTILFCADLKMFQEKPSALSKKKATEETDPTKSKKKKVK